MVGTRLIIDNFAGGGGASLGIEMAAWKGPDIAINHDPVAVGVHAVNHPHTQHLTEDVFAVDPRALLQGRPVGVAWFSPDCRHHSKAKGGKPVEKKIRGLAWVAMRWAALPRPMKPSIIALENVEEFQDWGPLLPDGRPDPARKGETFRLFVRRLGQAGYEVDYRELRACDYGAPTIRKRLYLVARSDGLPIRWPEPSHARRGTIHVAAGRAKPWGMAADCIDWSIPCPSIFDRKKPLAEKTMARIARGVKRFVIDAAEPFIVPVTHAGDLRSHPVSEPFRTITGAHRGEHALVAPFLVPRYGERPTQDPRCLSIEEPMPTVVATANGGSLVAAFMTYAQQGGSIRSAADPLHTVTASRKDHNALAMAFMAQHNGGSREMDGRRADDPVSTVTTTGSQQGLVSAFLTKFYGTCKDGVDLREPFPTVTSGGDRGGHHVGEVRAFLMKYYGTGGQLQGCAEPMHTLPTKARMGLVTVAGVDYQIVDIGMRMLTPRELFRAQGFPDSYVIDRLADGTPVSKTDQIRLCGNSVCPQVARAILEANFANEQLRHAA